jgi:predicted MFS family arabinose efflux permease
MSWCALGIIVIANSICLFTTAYPMWFGLRFAAGVGMGLVGGVMYATAAADTNPQRAFALIGTALLSYAVLFLVCASFLSAKYGITGLFGLTGAAAALGCAAIYWLPERGGLPSELRHHQTWVISGRAFLLLAGFLLLNAGHSLLWAFQGPMGTNLGLTDAQVGYLLSGSVMGGIIGSLLALRAKLSFGFVKSQMLALVGLVSAALMLAYSRLAPIYALATILIKIAWFFGTPYMQAAISKIDPLGRLIAFGTAATTIGASLGPATGGIVVGYGLQVVGLTGVVYYLVWAVLTLPVLYALDRQKAQRSMHAS